MPVPLPPAPGGLVPLPLVPNDPPLLQDVTNAIRYSARIKIDNETRRPGTATNDDVARAAIYETNVMVAHSAGPPGAATPAWFGPALNQGLNQALAPALNQALNQALAPLKRTIAKSFNLQCDNGISRSFEIVPFLDGRLPTGPPYNLPALVNVGAIQALSAAEAGAYVNGYGLGVIHLVVERKRAIGREIGCTAEV